MKSALIRSALAASFLLLGAGAQAQQQINLTAGPTSATLPDGTTVPMWGYRCGTPVPNSLASCAALNPAVAAAQAAVALGTATAAQNATAASWSPIVITVPAGQALQVNLVNNLVFAGGAVPTSLLIPGQLGGGLGLPSKAASPTHTTYGNTWFTAGTTSGSSFTPPAQGNRVQSFGTEVVAAGVTPGTGQIASGGALTWAAPRAGTYLLESGTHPSIQVPMGLYGMVVVTQAPTATPAQGCAYPAKTGSCPAAYAYDAEAYLLASEIDAVQNAAVAAAVATVGFSETATQALRDTLADVIVTAGGSGYTAGAAVTFGPAAACQTMPAATVGTVDASGAITSITIGSPGVNCSQQLTATVGGGTGAILSPGLALAGTMCSAGAGACYPPAVNYSPAYYLVNGSAFDKTNAASAGYSVVSPYALATNSQVLVRLANAGLRMHVPAIVNATTGGAANKAGMTLLAEDGNPYPGTARIQSEVFLAAGQTEDAMINAPTAGNGYFPVFDRELSLSANSVNRDSGMLAYLVLGTGAVPTAMAGTGAAAANADTYNTVIAGRTVTVSDPSLGVLANDVNVLGAKLVGATVTTNPDGSTSQVSANGTMTLFANGTFTYVPSTAVGTTFPGDTFNYCGNGTTAGAACTSITLNSAPVGGPPVANADSYTSTVSTTLTIHGPGVLANDTDPTGYALTAVTTSATLTSGTGTVTMFPDGGFTIAGGTPGSASTFTYIAQNSQGTQSQPATVTVNFPVASGLQVTVLDPVTNKPITDYRWIIEEDRTFYVDPNCTSNPLPAGCTGVTALDPTQSTPFGFGTNFHTSHMPVVATGCTSNAPGNHSCEQDQTLQGQPVACDIGNGVCRAAVGGQTPVLPSQVALDPTKRYYISVLPGDAVNPFAAGYGGVPCSSPNAPANCITGHGMGGVAIPAPCKPQTVQASCTAPFAPVTVLTEPTPYPTGKLTVHVFEDDFPLDGIFSPGGGVDVVQPNEPGLGGFEITLLDAGGGPGDATGQVTYDMFNQPLSNSLVGSIDPVTGNDACPVSTTVTQDALQGVPITASFGAGATTFTIAQAAAPKQLVVGVTLADSAAGGAKALLPGTTVTKIVADSTNTNFIVTISKPAQAAAANDPVSVTGSQHGVVGMIVTCPKYESDGLTLSPMAGMAVIANLPPARYSVVANPGAERFAAGEEWLQTNTLDGQKGHDSFIRIGEPAYFQEYGPSGFHVDIGFANPAIINARIHNKKGTGMCDGAATGGGGLACNNSVKGHITSSRLSRTPDQRIYGSRTRQSLSFTQCYVSLGDPDGFDFAFTKCDSQGNFAFSGIPAGNWKITTFDQWNDQIIDGITTPVGLGCNPQAGAGLCPAGQAAPTQGLACTTTNGVTTCALDMGEIATHQWQANIYTRTFLDLNRDGISNKDANGNDTEPGLPLENVNNRWRDGSFSNYNNTDLNGYANYNEVFPLFNWYVFDSYQTRYKTTGVHVVMDAGGPVDVDPVLNKGKFCDGVNLAPDQYGNVNGDRACGVSNIAANMANTYDFNPLPRDLMLPGAVYCNLANSADCNGKSINLNFKGTVGNQTDAPQCVAGTGGLGESCSPMSTGRIDPPYWFGSYGWQGFIGQNQFLEYGKAPYVPGETGGIRGHVTYASTRPYDDPQLLLQNQWEPLIPGVTINLYQEITAPDGTQTLQLVDHTTTTSFDDWAQGFRHNADGSLKLATDGKSGVPNMSCPGQTTNDPQFFALADQPSYLDWYTNVLHGTAATATALPYNSQFKCYDGMHNWNQLQPVPYDGLYAFPSVTGIDPVTGRPTGTNCTICTTNPDTQDYYRYGGTPFAAGARLPTWQNNVSQGTPVLPPGKYVVEVVIPPGYELVKEEDKNILMGDAFTAPATVQFPGLGGSIFIMPDQASLSAYYGQGSLTGNPLNPQNQTANLGRTVNEVSHEGDTKQIESYWPCVGALRQVPDYLSLFPNSGQISPFAGAFRNLCDRKEVLLTDQSSAEVKFFLFTSTHVAAHFTGVILDDFTGEFDPFSPQWGEKFGPPYVPVSVKDWAGYETNRVYSDEFGLYNGLNYSTWEVNPPNPTGYSPTMMVMCMNDSGIGTKSPWWDATAVGTTSATPDPYYQPLYSQFCYELAFMPGQTGYFDTPVVPVASFSEGYNHADCAYPDATPAIKEVDGDGVGPWVANAGNMLTITALGDQQVNNYAYSGPNATSAPFNQRTVTRHYGFGTTGPTANCAAGQPCVKLVTSNGWSFPLAGVTWTDLKITGTVSATGTDVNGNAVSLPNCAGATPTAPVAGCPLQQQAYYATLGNGAGTTPTPIQAGQLVITAANGRTSTDAITVWIGGKAPTHIAANATIQAAIDAAAPGDLLMVDPGAHNEMVQMWKPVRLQGVGAAASLIDANSQPSGRLLDPWRTRVNCLMGLTPEGRPRSFNDTSCTSGWAFASGGSDYPTMISERLPLEAVLGWDAALNANIAEQLIEPSLLGAYEGAAITVLAKGVRPPAPATLGANALLQYYGADAGGTPAAYPDNTVVLQPSDCALKGASGPLYPTLYHCNPSSIDGLGIHDASQGGGGIFVHAWGHNLQITNNRVFNNTGTSGGGITLGLGETTDPQQAGTAPTNGGFPGSCDADANGNSLIGGPVGMLLPHCYNLNVRVHNNWVSLNSSLGDELFSSTPSGAGGIAINNGDDGYQVTRNWVCGNLNVGDGGGISHIGFSNGGLIQNNSVLFNESTNPTIATNGGGVLLMGAPDADPTTCGVTTDIDCVPPPSTINPSNGIGRNNVVDANLILGNAASSGAGGGLRLQHGNGMDVVNLPDGAFYCPAPTARNPAPACYWNSVAVTNNIIANNVAGWDGAGVSLQDTLVANIVNNTIVRNDSTASSGVLLQSLFASTASSAGTNSAGNGGAGGITAGSQANVNCPANATAINGSSCPQVSGVASTTNSPVLQANIQASLTGSAAQHRMLTCPGGHGTATASTSCYQYSVPELTNDLIWQNRSYYIGVGDFATGQANKQHQVTLYNAFTTQAAGSQASTGACVAVNSYWEVGVRGDQTVTGHESGYLLAPSYSGLTDAADYPNANNFATDPGLQQMYCNGSRTPPENGGLGWAVPPGTIESNGLPTPVFSLQPSAVVDEGNNWVNLRWGPLSLVSPVDGVTPLANFNPVFGSPVTSAGLNLVASVPTTARDFNGTARPRTTAVDVGAVQSPPPPPPVLTLVSPTTWSRGLTTAVHFVGTYLQGGTVNLAGAAAGTACTVSTPAPTSTDLYANCSVGSAQAVGSTLTATVSTAGGTSNGLVVTVGATPPATVTGISPNFGDHIPFVGLPVNVTISGTNFTSGSTVAVSCSGTGCVNGVSVSNVNVTSPTTITATFTIAGVGLSNASPAGPRTVSVTTLAGAAANQATFYVGPYVTSIVPAAGSQGTTVPVTLIGYGLTMETQINVSGGNVTVSNFGTTPANPVTGVSTAIASLAIGSNAAAGGRNVTTSLFFGLVPSNAVTFTVQPVFSFAGPAPSLVTGGVTAHSGTLTVNNVSTHPVTLAAAPTVARVSGPTGGTFAITGGTCTSGAVVGAGGSCTVVVQYTPPATGTSRTGNATANVTVSAGAAGSGTSANFSAN